MSDKDNSYVKQILSGIAISVGVSAITGVAKIIKGLKSSVIDIGEWDRSYNNINKLIYKLNPDTYTKNRIPTTNKDYYELCGDTAYFIKVKKNNFIKVETYKNMKDKSYYPENRIKIIFYGKERYAIRERFLNNALKITDDNHIRVQYLNEQEMSCDIIPHSFDNIVLDSSVKKRIINGLDNWESSKGWYKNHQLVHKIGVLLYGKPGTGKSTIAKAISTKFSNAPILTIDPQNIMNSINVILKMRKKYDGTIIVLIEDFDMFFKSREEIEGMELDVAQKKQKDVNQNAIFQLLDGIYSTENTIYVATTNYKDRIDSALIRHGRFDIQEELEYFDRGQALECLKLLGYGEDLLEKFSIDLPVQPSLLQSKVMEHRANLLVGQ